MRTLLSALLLFLSLTGCGNADRRAVEEVLHRREQAMATGDTALYASIISSAYQDKGMDCRAKNEDMIKIMNGFGRIDYRSLNRTVQIEGDSATVSDRYAMKVTFRGKPLELAGEATLRLRRETGGWKIVAGL
ncbi:MAG: nuclear transport factor 2 family protein [Desulfuromonadales bacterium]|nr:MAG: nuclear transport factor 2 family protein [Desulfuromonadales bacterium]